ncbi:NUDIX hydrolase [Candidatus Woesearchaeota archaeon]|nr:NUDIX hydrolase [Candidatus Woesearchaeota archaeon]
MSHNNNPPTAVDVIIEHYEDNKMTGIVLVTRKNPPFQGMLALPGGFQEVGETLEEAAVRESKEETTLDVELYDCQLRAYSEPDRDPRAHVNSVGFVGRATGIPIGKDDAKKAGVFPLSQIPKLAFDHNKRVREYEEWKVLSK